MALDGWRCAGPACAARRSASSAARALTGTQLDERISTASFACRVGRSVARPLDRLARLAQGYGHGLDADIRGFCDEVRHDRLLGEPGVWIGDAHLRPPVRRAAG